jgi:hypothetical protein
LFSKRPSVGPVRGAGGISGIPRYSSSSSAGGRDNQALPLTGTTTNVARASSTTTLGTCPSDNPKMQHTSQSTLSSVAAVKTESQVETDSKSSAWDSDPAFVSQLHPALQAHVRAEMIRRQKQHELQMKALEPYRSVAASSTTPDVQTSSNSPTSISTPSVGEPITHPALSHQNPLPSPAPVSTTPKSQSAPKRTYVPPPRPWEMLRKSQQGQGTASSSPNPSPTTTLAPASSPNPFVHNGMAPLRHSVGQEPQPGYVSTPLWQ